MPGPVDRYFHEVKDKNPGYSDAQAWATAWSIYCKHKHPNSSHCHKKSDQYLNGKQASDPASVENVLEQASFDMGDGSLNLSLIEKLYDMGGHGYCFFRYSLSHYGSQVTGELPLIDPSVVTWLVGALARTSARTRPYWNGSNRLDVSVKDGERQAQVVARVVERYKAATHTQSR